MKEELFEKIVLKLLKENKQEQLKERLRTIFEYSEDEDFEKFFNLIIKSFYMAANNSGNKEKSKRVFDTILEMTEDIMALGAPDNFSKNFNEIFEKSEIVAKQDPEWLKRSKSEVDSTKKPEKQEEKQKTSSIEERLKRADISVLNQLGNEWKKYNMGLGLVFVIPTKYTIQKTQPYNEDNNDIAYIMPEEEELSYIGINEALIRLLFNPIDTKYKEFKCKKAALFYVRDLYHDISGDEKYWLNNVEYWSSRRGLEKGTLEPIK